MKGNALLLLFAALWSAATLAADAYIGEGIAGQLEARSFLTAPGVVTRSEIETSTDADGTTYLPLIEFAFTVADSRIRGTRVRFTELGSTDADWARGIAAKYPVGTAVTVHYDPADPSRAILETGVSNLDLFMLLFLAPFNVIMAGAWVYLARAVRRPRAAGGVQILERPGRTHVRLPTVEPLAAAGAAAVGFPFALSLVVAILFGLDAPVESLAAAWAISIGGAAAVYLKFRTELSSGAKDLVIDDQIGRLALPRTFKRRGESGVSLSEVAGVATPKVTPHEEGGAKSACAVELVIREAAGGLERRERLADWHEGERAGALADWLAERLKVPRLP